MLPLHVLIIEDSESDAGLVIRQLQKADYVVTYERVDTSVQMKAALEKQSWDIIIADYQLPDFNAQAALAQLQETALEIPFIVVSGAIGEETAVSLMRSGAHDYLMKGNLARLVPVVKRELSEAKIRREQKKAEDLIRLQSAALNAAANAIVITNREGMIEWVNLAFSALTGYASSQAVGKNMYKLVDSGLYDPEFYQQIWDTLLAGDVWQGELTSRHRDGQIYIEEQTITPLRDTHGQISQFIIIKQDITRRKRLEKDMHQWADAFENCAHGIAMADPFTNNIIACNPAFARLHRATGGDMIGQRGKTMYTPDEYERIKHFIDVADRDGQIQFETVKLRKDGTSFPAQLDLVSVRDVDGKLLYRVASLQDITQRKQAEQALLKQMEESQHKTHELELITEISSSMRLVQTQAQLFEVILHKLVELLNVQVATIAILEGDWLTFECVAGEKQLSQKQQIQSNLGVFGEVIRTGQPVKTGISNPDFETNLPTWAHHCFSSAASLLVYPVKSEQKTIGLIALAYDQQTLFLPEQINLVASVSEIAGSALNRMFATAELEAMIRRREKELENIYQVTSAATRMLDIHQSLQDALVLTLDAVHADRGGIYLLDETDGHPELIVYQGTELNLPENVRHASLNNFLGWVVQNKKTVVIPDLMSDPRVLWTPDPGRNLAFIGVPMLNQERVIGIVGIIKEGKNQVNVEEMSLLSFIADHLALVVENSRLYKKAEYSAVMEERSRLARELHDSVTQSLFSANLYVAGAQKFATQGNYARVDSYLNQIGHLTQQSLRDMRLLVYELRNVELFENGLLSALQNRLDAVERRSGIKVDVQATPLSRLPDHLEENLYRVVIEALNNALKHAQASQLWIELKQTNNQLELVIRDDGQGVDMASKADRGGMGLTTMRDRTRMMGGDFQFHSSPGNGTCIEIKVPILDNRGSENGGND